MILGAEIGMLIMGIIALVTGRLTLSKTHVVRGTPARLLALLALLPMPLSFACGFVLGVVYSAQGREVTDESFRWTATGIEAAVVVLCLVALYGIGWPLASKQGQAKPYDERDLA